MDYFARVTTGRSLVLLLAVTVCLAPQVQGGAAGGDVAVVAGADVKLESLSKEELRKILLGDKQFWSGNKRITVLLRAPVSRERDAALRICQMTEARFRQWWIAKVFRAEAPSGPKTVDSGETALKLVEQIPGAIALVDYAEVRGAGKWNVLRVDNHMPGDNGYPLR